jgi:hypothetical protein
MPSRITESSNGSKPCERLAQNSPSTAIKAPAPITKRASMRSSNHPAIGAETPIASDSPPVIQETRAWLQPKAFSSAARKIGAVL